MYRNGYSVETPLLLLFLLKLLFAFAIGLSYRFQFLHVSSIVQHFLFVFATERPFLELKAAVSVEVGDSVNEICKAIGNPKPKVYWRQKASGERMSSESHSSRYHMFNMIEKVMHGVTCSCIQLLLRS